MMDAAGGGLVVRGLACRRNERLLFRDLSFALPPGGALVLTGRNGAGKTSLLRILGGLLSPEAGSVAVPAAAGASSDEADPGSREENATKQDDERPLATLSLLVGARDPLKPALTVAEMLDGWASLLDAGTGAAAQARAAFRLEGLAGTPCAWLSSGQRRRLSLARLALLPAAVRPLWLLDEPANALDGSAQQLLADAVASHRAAGGIVVAASHLPLGWPDLAELALGAPA